MNRLDRLITELAKAGGEALIFTSQRPIHALISGSLRPTSSKSVSTDGIISFLNEIAPGGMRESLDDDCNVTFPYKPNGGPDVEVTVERKGTFVFAKVRLDQAEREEAPEAAEPAPKIVPPAAVEPPKAAVKDLGKELFDDVPDVPDVGLPQLGELPKIEEGPPPAVTAPTRRPQPAPQPAKAIPRQATPAPPPAPKAIPRQATPAPPPTAPTAAAAAQPAVARQPTPTPAARPAPQQPTPQPRPAMAPPQQPTPQPRPAVAPQPRQPTPVQSPAPARPAAAPQDARKGMPELSLEQLGGGGDEPLELDTQGPRAGGFAAASAREVNIGSGGPDLELDLGGGGELELDDSKRGPDKQPAPPVARAATAPPAAFGSDSMELDTSGADEPLELDTGGTASAPATRMPDLGGSLELEGGSERPPAETPADDAEEGEVLGEADPEEGEVLELAEEADEPRAPAAAPAPAAASVAPVQDTAPREVPPALRSLLQLLLSKAGSDLHVSACSPPRLRIFGELTPLETAALTPESTEAMLWAVLSPERRKAFAKEMSIDFSLDVPGVGRFRANGYRQRKGLDLVFRAIPNRVPSFTELGLPPAVERLTQYPNGLILVTGPAGCGKSTTQAAIIDRINETWKDHIITVEDPVEFVHPIKNCLINQREVGTHVRTFAEALKSALREDPDVILVGELRDLETIQLAITAAETGHLVIGTLHTINAAGTINRLIDVFPGNQKLQIRSMVSESLRGVISQQLLRTADGKGRVAAFELLLTDRSISNLIREGKTFQIPNLLKVGKAKGMSSMEDAIVELVRARKVSPEVAMEHMERPEELQKQLEGGGRRPGPAGRPARPEGR